MRCNVFGVFGLPSASKRLNKVQSLLSSSNCNTLCEELTIDDIGILDESHSMGSVHGIVSQQVKYKCMVCDSFKILFLQQWMKQWLGSSEIPKNVFTKLNDTYLVLQPVAETVLPQLKFSLCTYCFPYST